MKKLTSLLLSLVLMVSVLACGASAKTSTKVRIAGLKGPTTMGLVNLLSMEKDGNGRCCHATNSQVGIEDE